MKHYLVLENSEFSIDPPGGVLLYKTPAGKPKKDKLVEGRELGETVPYRLLNPIQTLFFKKYRKGNALVTAPTSAGKSLIAYNFMKDKKGRRVYTAPTKSLVYEKAVELRGLFGKKVDMRTGDIIELYKATHSDVIVATYENLALALRNKLPWATEAESVVIDEIHHLMGSRGWVLEEIITHLLERGIEMLGLSATLPGSIKLAKWIKAELFIESLWIFVHKKSVGWKVLELANGEKIGVMNETVPFDREERDEVELAFHNADIPKEEREDIERAFRKGELPVLVATHTLAYGVNLPADTVMIGVRAFYDRREGKWKVFPGQLDILQMEGRAGRLGIKEKGYSYILPYGAKPHTLEEQLERSLEEEFSPYLQRKVREGELSEELEKVLSLFILIGFLYEGKNFRRFLRRTFSLKDYSKDPMIDDIYEWLEDTGYIDKGRLSDKALFCIRAGMPPINYEEFLRRKLLGLEKPVVIRPLLFVKRFEGLYEFVKRGETFPEDEFYIRSKLAPCGGECFADNTHQFLFYIEGLTFKYRNVQHPPGEFSYLGTDALHLIRILLDIRSFGDLSWSNEEILRIAHSVKYGLTEEFSALGGIKGIGHIRANLLKRLLHEEGLKPPPIGGKTEMFIETLKCL